MKKAVITVPAPVLKLKLGETTEVFATKKEYTNYPEGFFRGILITVDPTLVWSYNASNTRGQGFLSIKVSLPKTRIVRGTQTATVR